MLLIEGSDNLGKTILAKKIVRKIAEIGLPVVYGWMTRPNENIFDFFLDYKKLLNPYAVQDRFHLSGYAYHEDKISTERLQIINAWVRSVGGLIVVLYASNDEWYEEHIKQDKRKNILSWPALCKANENYYRYVKRNDGGVDYSFNVLPHGFDHNNINYVDDYDIGELMEDWLNRRDSLGL